MKNYDILQRFIFENTPIRGEIVRLNSSYKTIISQHDYPDFINRLLGEMLVIATLLSAVIKFSGRLTVQFQGKGRLKLLLAQCDQEQHIRGLAQWDKKLREDELTEMFKNGVLAIIIQGDEPSQRYQGVVAWQGGSLAESVEGYFRDSEQLLTKVWLAVEGERAAGMLLQVMPEGTAHDLAENPQAWDSVVHLTQTLSSQELLDWDNETLLRKLYSFDNEVRVFEPHPILFQCTCSLERSENALLLLGKEEIDAELESKNQIVVTCDFCNKEYVFDRVDIAALFKRKGDSSSSSRVH